MSANATVLNYRPPARVIVACIALLNCKMRRTLVIGPPIGAPDLPESSFAKKVQALAHIVAAVTIGLSQAACSPDRLSWDEDVLLPDGRTVTLHRTQDWKDGREGEPSDYRFEFKDPDTGQLVRWTHDRHLTTMVLFKSDRSVYLVLKPLWGSSLDLYKCPNPPYFLRKSSGTADWIDLPIQEIPVKHLKVNMTDNISARYELIKKSKNHLSVTDTQSRTVQTNSPPYVAPYTLDFSNVSKQTFGFANCPAGRADLLYPNQIR